MVDCAKAVLDDQECKRVAAATGIVNHPVVPIGIIVLAVAAAVLIANAMAFVMARPLARVAPAAALRTE